MTTKYFWIKERHNPQLGVYWVTCGQMKISEAKKYEKSSYGNNYMHKFKTEEEYKAKITEIISDGETLKDTR